MKRLISILFSICLFVFFAEQPAQSVAEPDAVPDAVDLQAEQREQEIVERFWTLLYRSPRRGTALDRVYGHYVDTGQLDLLLERCRKLAEQSPEDAKAWMILGHVLNRCGDENETVEVFEKAEKLDPADPLSSFYLGEVLIAQGRLQEAAGALERAVDRKPTAKDALPILQTLGRVYERFNDLKKSAAVWEKMESMFPNDANVLAQIAETLDEEGKTEDALKRYEKLIQWSAKNERRDDYARVRYTLAAADLKIRLGKKQDAIADFETILEQLAAGSWLADTVQDRIERVFGRSADYAGLASYYQKRLEKRPNDLDTIQRLAKTLVRLSRHEEARELLESALQRAPSTIPLRLALIDLLVFEKNFDEVDAQYDRILESVPNHPDYVIQRGLAVMENRNLAPETRKVQAVKIWSRLVENQPNNAANTIVVADLMAGAGIDDEAEKLYNKAIELRPDEPTYREYLGYFFHRKKDAEKAVAAFKEIAEGNRRTVSTLSQLAAILKGLGYKKDALEAIRDAVKLDSKSFALQLRFVEILLENNDFDESREQLLVLKNLVESEDELEQFVKREVAFYQATRDMENAAESLLERLVERKTDPVLEPMKSSLELRMSGQYWNRFEIPKKEIEIDLLAAADKDARQQARELWRLAAFLQLLNKNEAAVETVEAALRLDPNSLLTLKTAANLYSKGYDEEKAASIFQRLASVDSPRRVDHLKKLANIQRILGQNDKALETARLVMATGAGNAANTRFYADMLLSIGRRDEGIEALRRAVRIDPSDRTTLNSLANALAEAGQTEESMQILWRIFQRTEEFQEKLGLVSRLAQFYQQERQFNRLIDRLRQGASDASGRRESAYCLAQAYISVNDFDAARKSLENLLVDFDAESDADPSSGDAILLTQLSKIAEAQSDLAAAIRYQEMLCEQTNKNEDFDRLLGLYYQGDEQEKARALFLKRILAHADLIERIAAVDTMLAREEYDTANTFFERIPASETGNWELLYRQMQLSYWTGDLDRARDIAEQLKNLSLDPETLSAEKERAKNRFSTALDGPAGSGTSSLTRISPFYSGGSYSSWTLAGNGHYMSLMMGENNMMTPEWNSSMIDMVPTLFREYLQYQDQNYMGGFGRRSGWGVPSTGKQPKPLFKPDNFGDMLFAVRFWEMKFAIERDALAAANKNESEEEQKEENSETENEESASNSGILSVPAGTTIDVPSVSGTSTLSVRSTRPFRRTVVNGRMVTTLRSTPNPAVALSLLPTPQPTSDKPLPGKKVLGPHFEAWVAEARAAYPEDDPELKTLVDRLRIEGMITAVKRFAPQGWFTLPKSFGKENMGPLRNRIVKRLGIEGEKDYRMFAFQLVQGDLGKEGLLEKVDSIDIDAEIARIRKQYADSGLDPNDVFQEDQFKANFKKRLEDFRKESEEKQRDPYTLEQKIEWALNVWQHSVEDSTRQVLLQYLPYYVSFSQLLREAGREDDIKRLDAVVDRVGMENPQVFLQMASLTMNSSGEMSPFSRLMSMDIGPMNVYNPYMGHVVFPTGNTSATSSKEENEKRFENVKIWLDKARDSMLAQIEKQATGSTSTPWAGGMMYYPVYNNFSIAHIMQPMLQQSIASVRQLLPAPTVEELARRGNNRNVSYQIVGGNIVPVHSGGNAASGTLNLQGEKRTISREELDRLLAVEAEIYRALDLCFSCNAEISEANEKKEKSRKTENASRGRRTSVSRNTVFSSGMSHQAYSFRPDQELRAHEIEYIMFGNYGRSQETQLITVVEQFFPMLDRALGHFVPGEGVEAEQLAQNHAERFQKYLDEKRTSGEKTTRLMLEQYRFTKSFGNDNDRKLDVKPIRDRLEEEFQSALKNAPLNSETNKPDMDEVFRTFSPNKMLLLARLNSNLTRTEKAIEYVDMLPAGSASEAKERELFMMQYFLNFRGSNFPVTAALRLRAETAIKRLQGHHLGEQELKQLRQGLIAFNRLDEADAIRNRLLATTNDQNTMYEFLIELTNANEDLREEAVRFALRVFRNPTIMNARRNQNNDMPVRLRDQAILVLKRFDKLDEIIEQLEAQVDSSPGSYDMLARLADVYFRAGRPDDAKRIVERLEKIIPDDAARIQSFIALLNTLEMTDKALQWNDKFLLKNPEAFFNDFYQQESRYRNSNQLDKLAEILKNMDPEILVKHHRNFVDRISGWSWDDRTKKVGKDMFDYLWNLEKVSKDQRNQIRAALLRNMVYQEEKQWAPYFREIVLQAIAVPEEGEYSPEAESPTPYGIYPMHYYENDRFRIHNAQNWSGERAKSYSTAFLTSVGTSSQALNTIRKEVRNIIADHEKVDGEDRAWNRYVDARVLDVMIEIRLQKHAEALVMLDELALEQEIGTHLDRSLCLLGSEFLALPDKAGLESAIRCFEKAAEKQQHGPGDLPTMLLTLYLRSNDPERGRGRAVAELEKNLRLLKLVGDQGSINIGNRHYDVHSLQNTIDKLLSALVAAGITREPLDVYMKECRGQAWFDNLMKSRNHNVDQIKKIQKTFDGLFEKIDAETVADNIELFLPMLPDENSDATQPEAAKPEDDKKKEEDRNRPGGRSPGTISMNGPELQSATPQPIYAQPLYSPPVAVPVSTIPASQPATVESTPTENSKPQKPATGVQLGTFCRSLDPNTPDEAGKKPDDPKVGSKLLDALRILKEKNPERFEQAKKSIAVFAEKNPDDGSPLIALGFCRMADGDEKGIREAIDTVSDWIDRQEKEILRKEKEAEEKGENLTNQQDDYGNPIKIDYWAVIPDDVYLGSWVLARNVLADKSAEKELRESAWKLAAFSGGYLRSRSGPFGGRGRENEIDRALSAAFADDVGQVLSLPPQAEVEGFRAVNLAEIFMVVADNHYRNNDRERGQKIAKEIAKFLPDTQASPLQKFSSLLNRLEMPEESAEWTMKFLAKSPETLFRNFYEHENKFRNAKRIDKLVELLKTIPPGALLKHFGNYSSNISSWMSNEDSKKAGRDFFDFLWNLKDISEADRDALRVDLLAQVISRNDAGFFPNFREVVFNLIRITDEEKPVPDGESETESAATEGDGEKPVATAATTTSTVPLMLSPAVYPTAVTPVPASSGPMTLPSPYYLGAPAVYRPSGGYSEGEYRSQHGRNNPLHRVINWTNDRGQSISTAFLSNKATTPEKLEEIRKEVAELIAEREKLDPENRNWERYVNAKMLAAMIELRLKNLDAALEILAGLDKETQAKGFVEQCNTVLGFELLPFDEKASVDRAISCFEKEVRKFANSDSSSNLILTAQLIRLYLKSDNPQRGRDKGVFELERNIGLLKRMNKDGQIRLGDRYYHAGTVLNWIERILNTMTEGGAGPDALRVYLRDCRGQAWFDEKTKGENYNFNRLKEIQKKFDALIEKATAEDIAENIELLIPMLPEEPEDDDKE